MITLQRVLKEKKEGDPPTIHPVVIRIALCCEACGWSRDVPEWLSTTKAEDGEILRAAVYHVCPRTDGTPVSAPDLPDAGRSEP